MAIENAKPDGNVPFIGPRGRFQLTGLEPAWIIQTMATATVFDKKLARTVALTAPELEPVVTAGKAKFSDLSQGGIFDTIATAKRSHVVEDILNAGGATLDIVTLEDLKIAQDGAGIHLAPKFRDVPGSFPFTLAPGETIRAAGAAAGTVGLYIREDLKAIR